MNQTINKKRMIEDMQKLPIIGKQPQSEKEENYLREICEYEFYNLEEPGISVTFPYGNAKYQHNFTFFHGGKYQLPRFIARHMESCVIPLWEWRPNGLGGLEKQRIGTKPRFQMRQVFGG